MWMLEWPYCFGVAICWSSRFHVYFLSDMVKLFSQYKGSEHGMIEVIVACSAQPFKIFCMRSEEHVWW